MSALYPQPLSIAVREAQDEDMAAIQAIYAYYVTRTCASFEEVPPGLDEMKRRRADIAGRGLPYLVADDDGEVLGFAYAGPFRPRSAYRYTVEDSIYVAPHVVQRGVGSQLLTRLVARCTELGYRQMIAVIGDSANVGSISVHRRAGFNQEGILRGVGLKFGRWVDVVIMHRTLLPPDVPPPEH